MQPPAEATISGAESSNRAKSVHLLPFGINYDGSANVADYFTPATQVDGDAKQHVTASFRGRRLKGVTKDLPDGYHGLVLKPCGQRATAGSDTEQRSWQTTLHFNQLTLWNHDLVPTATDWHNRCIDWLALADKIHAPVQLDQVEKELKKLQQQQQHQGQSGPAVGSVS